MTTTRTKPSRNGHAKTIDELTLPPQDLQAEKSVLGCCVLSDSAVDEVSEIIRPEHCYVDRHQTIYRTVLSMRSENRQIDVLTLMDELQQQGVLEDVGGLDYLNELMGTVAVTAHAASYAKTVLRMYRHRVGVEAGRQLIAGAHDLTTDIGETLAAAESKIHTAIEGGIVAGPKPIGDVLLTVLDSPPEEDDGLSSGFVEIDELTRGLHPARTVVIAARPSMGKTALACGVADRVAGNGHGVLICSYEMPAKEIAQRLLCIRSGTPWRDLRAMPNTLADVANELNRMPILIDDAGHDINKLIATIRLAARKGIKLAIIDYLQLVPPEDASVNREQQVATCSRKLKQVAMATGISVIFLSQLNRQVENRPDARPRLSDLRESGAIEQDADQVWMLWRPNKGSTDRPDDVACLDIAKNRSGPTGIVELGWHGPTATFASQGRNA